MTFGSALYKLIIGPLELFFEVLFSIVNRFTQNPGISIVFLSLAINFLVLPMYKRADEMQAEERDIEAKLRPWVKHIRKTFSGDERFMMLQTYYRQNNYKPSYSLRGSLSLLLQIPFFIAAYHFLSNLPLLQGLSFGPIQNLGAPDGLLTIHDLQINLLPILMTTINLISASIYLKGFPPKDKLQTVILAFLFLVLLYSSPAGLVFYWTLNNTFSLCKNIFYKIKNPLLIKRLGLNIAGALLLLLVLLHPFDTTTKNSFVVMLAFLLQLPLVLPFLSKNTTSFTALSHADYRIFLSASILLTILTGVLIPSAIISTSPLEFIDLKVYHSPFWLIVSSSLLAAGTFIVWLGVFFHIASSTGKQFISALTWIGCGVASINYMFFGSSYGNLSNMLIYDNVPAISFRQFIINITVILLVILLFSFLWKKQKKLVNIISISVIFTLIIMSGTNIISSARSISKYVSSLSSTTSSDPHFSLSKGKKNVVVLMMDRAISSYIPFLFNENPVLQRQFEGFTYYPNTISFGHSTNFGTPPLFGGYEYTPIEMNKRNTESLESKQNEALRVLPLLFSSHDYDVSVFDPSYAGYEYIPDLSIYSDHPEIHAFNANGYFSIDPYQASNDSNSLQERNFFCYSITRIAPLFLFKTLYDSGLYNNTDFEHGNFVEISNSTNSHVQLRTGLSKAYGYDTAFLNTYPVLLNLPSMTTIADSDCGSFMMMSNETTHAYCYLEEPQYAPSADIDNTEFDLANYNRTANDGRVIHLDDEWQVMAYQVNMAAMIQLGNWFDYLRDNDVFDNTRIIIVSDHGWPLGHFDEMIIGDGFGEDTMRYNALLMVKDYNSNTFTTNWDYMTVADVPTLATDEIIENPVNPCTNNPISSAAKDTLPGHLILWSPESNIYVNNGNTFMPGTWYLVGDNIFDRNEWSIYLDESAEN